MVRGEEGEKNGSRGRGKNIFTRQEEKEEEEEDRKWRKGTTWDDDDDDDGGTGKEKGTVRERFRRKGRKGKVELTG
ncbi:hypothetical protein Pcinc_041823, partial [Petrolisthes cinctipes]